MLPQVTMPEPVLQALCVAGVALARFARARGEVLPDRPWRFEATAETSEALGASLAVASRACPVPPGAFLGATSFLLRGPGRLDRVDSEEAGDTPIAEAPRRVLFPIALRRAEDGPGWLASCPVAPGCEAQGETYVGAVEAAKEAIALALEARAAGQEPAWPLPDGAAIVSVDLPEAPGPATLARADGTGERVPEQLGLAL